MADGDDSNQTSTTPEGEQPPAGGTESDKTTVTPPSSTTDPVKLAQDLGEAKAKLESLEKYQQQVDPVLQTIYSDQAVYNSVLQAHNKRTGVTPPDVTTSTTDGADIPVVPSSMEIDNRNTLLNRTLKDFYKDKQIEVDSDTDKKVAKELKDMLDPMGNKTLNQVLQDVSLTKLPEFLEKAHYLATKDDQLKEAEQRGRQQLHDESVGVMGSFSSTSIEPDSITLSTKEKEVAANMGISEEKYLENKKKLMVPATPT